MKNEKLQSETWRKMKLGEVLNMKYGFGLPESKRRTGDVPVFGSSGFVGTHNEAAVSSEGLVIGRKGHVGSIYYSTEPFHPIDTVYFVNKLKIPGDLKFFYYFLQRIQFEKIGSNVGVPGLNRDVAYSLEVLIPEDPKTQKRIADILSAFDDKIELNNKISRVLEEMAQAIFKEWFVNFRFPGYEKVKMVDSELGKIPDGWRVKKIKDVCNQIVNGGTPRREIREYWINGTIPWITTSELQDRVIFNTNEKISKTGHENSSTKLLPQNTIVIALYASPTLGRLGLLKIEATTNQACSALVTDESIGYGYLFYWLLNQREYLQGLAVGAAQQNINQEVIRELNILQPDKQILNRFQEFIGELFDSLTNIANENQKLAALRDLLLPKLMSGEIRV